MRPLAVVGNVNVDLIMGPVAPWPQPGTEVMVAHDDLRVGGAAGNAALAWQAMGVPFQAAANIGSDLYGTWLAEAFPAHAPDWPVSLRRTTVSVGLTHPGGERTFFTTDGHLQDMTAEVVLGALDGPALRGGVLLLCGSFVTERLAPGYESIFDWADQHAVDVALDTGWPSGGWTEMITRQTLGWLARCKIAMLNEVEATGLTGIADLDSAASNLRSAMPKGSTVVIKQGPKGVLAVDARGESHSVPARPVRVIDTIGAGDIFNAGFLAGFARNDPMEACLTQGVSIAAAAISTFPRRFDLAEQDLSA